jgi:membrane protein DedA with SNARE-associated domain
VSRRNGRGRVVLLALAGLRIALGVIAIPLVPVLWRRHFVVLLLLRPTKEVLLAGGFLARRHDVPLGLVVVTAIPLLIGGVWLFFLLGKLWAPELDKGKGLPSWAQRILPRKRIRAMRRLVDQRGARVVFLGRLAVFPSSIIAAAAGTSDMNTRTFLIADGLGGLVSIVEVVGVGYLLGEQYESGKHWLTVAGVVVLFGLLVIVGRWLRGQSGRGT